MKSYSKHSHKGIRAKKFLGQHFLNDPHIAKQIGETVSDSPSKNILEIGPGTGVLTQHLLEKEINLAVMELDREAADYLKRDFKIEHPPLSKQSFAIIEADFLKYELNQLFEGEEFGIIGNFPYNISSQILFKTIENRARIPFFSGMFQKEVARRICEDPGSKTYGILSVLTQVFYDATYLFSVSPQVFIPPPKVESGVIKLVRKNDFHLPCSESLFMQVVKQGFQQRRKTLRNSLKALGLPEHIRNLTVFDLRPEQLSPEDFIELTLKIEESRT